MLLSFWIDRGGTGLLAASWSLIAWLVTYSVHAAIAASIAALGTRPRRDRAVALGSAARHHLLWKLALWLPLATATGSAAMAMAMPMGMGMGSAARDHGGLNGRGLTLIEAATPSERPSSLLVITRTPAVGRAAEGLAGLATLALLLGMAHFVRSARQLSRQLRDRVPARNPRFQESLGRVSRSSVSTSVHLTESDRIDGPMVVGVSEICFPSEGMPALSARELDAVMAHELAHLERRDGLWVPLMALLRACLWFHPLTRWLSSRVAETAELACDDRAVSFISDPSILARALALVAATNRDRTNDAKKDATNDGPWSLLPAMASPRSKLFVRVQRLARPDELPSRGAHPRRERALSIALVVLSLGSLGVSVQFAPRAEAAPAADTASLAATMTKLFVEESHVSSQLAQMLATLAGLGAAAEEKPAVIELRQDLRHIHQMQAWIEAQLAAATAPSAPASSRPSS